MVLIVHGFPSKVQGLQFEWCWQKPRLSNRVREVRRSPCAQIWTLELLVASVAHKLPNSSFGVRARAAQYDDINHTHAMGVNSSLRTLRRFALRVRRWPSASTSPTRATAS